MTHGVKVPIFMIEVSRNKIIHHHFHVDNGIGELGIVNDIVIGRDLMVQLGLLANFKHQIFQSNGIITPMKEPNSLIRKSDITSCDMHEVVIKTLEPFSTRIYTEILVKILDITYVRAYLKQVIDNTTQLNVEEKTELLSLLIDYEYVFDGNL